MKENSVQMFQLNDENKSFSGAIDWFILSLSSEERCFRILELLLQKEIKIKQLIVFIYDKYEEVTVDKEIEIKLNKCAEKVKFINCYEINPGQDGVELSELDIDRESSVGIDITGFAIPDIFRIFYVLSAIRGINQIKVFYTEPKYYYYQNGLFTTYERNAGECRYEVVEEYNNSGNGKKEILVCFLGFDRNVSKYVYDKVVPYETVVVNGFPSYMPKLKDISLLNNYELISTVGTDKVVSVRANSPYAAFNCLREISKKYDNALLNICVLGTKPMAVGAALFSLRNLKKVKVSFPFPEKYRSNYSVEIGDSWCYQINI